MPRFDSPEHVFAERSQWSVPGYFALTLVSDPEIWGLSSAQSGRMNRGMVESHGMLDKKKKGSRFRSVEMRKW